jgi:adenylate cyclase
VVRECGFTAAAFTGAVYLYYLVAFWGVRDFFIEGSLKDYMTSSAVHVELLMTGLLFGGLIGVINRIADTPRFRARPCGQIVLLRTALYVASIALVAGIVASVVALLIVPWEQLVAITQTMQMRYGVSLLVWQVLVVIAINSSLEIERLVGPGNLWRLLVGRYRKPRDEERLFLFMDMKASTTTAELLGHQRFSQLLQLCFQDLTRVALRYEAAIYQYVGDEVVLSWPDGRNGQATTHSVQAFFAYEQALSENKEAYRRRFGGRKIDGVRSRRSSGPWGRDSAHNLARTGTLEGKT